MKPGVEEAYVEFMKVVAMMNSGMYIAVSKEEFEKAYSSTIRWYRTDGPPWLREPIQKDSVYHTEASATLERSYIHAETNINNCKRELGLSKTSDLSWDTIRQLVTDTPSGLVWAIVLRMCHLSNDVDMEPHPEERRKKT